MRTRSDRVDAVSNWTQGRGNRTATRRDEAAPMQIPIVTKTSKRHVPVVVVR
jgi:hypothetical protein